MNNNDQIINETTQYLNQINVFSKEMIFNERKYRSTKKKLANIGWNVPSTTISPRMERLLFSIGQDLENKKIVWLGSYYGYGFFWLIASNYQKDGYYKGYDVNFEACVSANKNVERYFGNNNNVSIVKKDALEGVNDFSDNEIDILFIDVEAGGSKALYKDLLISWYRKLKPNGYVLAHDICVEKFKNDLMSYTETIRKKAFFNKEISLPIDECGLHIVSQKRSSNE